MHAFRNAPAAATVLARHLARGSAHAPTLPWHRHPSYAAALAALADGELLVAEDLARAAGLRGRLLAAYVAGELGVLAGAGEHAGSADAPVAPARIGVVPAPAPGAPVLHLVTNALPETVAGYTIRTQGIAGAQRAAGRDAHVATRLGFPVVKGHLRARPEVEVAGVPHHRLLPRRLPLRADTALARDVDLTGELVARLRPAVLHAHSHHVNARVALALRARFAIPVVYEARGFLEETWRSRSTTPGAEQADAYRLARAAESRCLHSADAVVTLSHSMRDAIVARGVDVAKVHVVPNCVDERFLRATPATSEGNPCHLGGLTVGFVGTLNGYEGVDVLVHAVAGLRRRGLDVHLRVVGDGPERAALERLAAELGIAAATTFTGRVPHEQVVAEHQRLDVFCLPRRDLPVTRLVPPLKPVEAMALARPVVASDLPPLRELVQPHRGELVTPEDPDALAAALARLSGDPAARLRLGATARAWVAENRTWAAAADAYEQIYRRIQGEAP